MFDTVWRCPVCGAPLQAEDKNLFCSKGHSFDRARSGYVNLLSAGRHAAVPGDNPEMVRARRRFLEKGYYGHLLEALQQAVKEYCPEDGVLLDAGCGEGWYTRQLCRNNCYGIDISKKAADMAAKADKQTDYAVASVFHLPVQDSSCDAVVSVFAPYCGEEFLRILRPGGCLIMAIPAARHLWELKAAVYDHPYENEVKDYALEGFAFCRRLSAEREIFLDSSQDITDLFGMTPYAYRTGKNEISRLSALHELSVLAAFEVLVYRKEMRENGV